MKQLIIFEILLKESNTASPPIRKPLVHQSHSMHA